MLGTRRAIRVGRTVRAVGKDRAIAFGPIGANGLVGEVAARTLGFTLEGSAGAAFIVRAQPWLEIARRTVASGRIATTRTARGAAEFTITRRARTALGPRAGLEAAGRTVAKTALRAVAEIPRGTLS